jgi:excisionase family DNA binding protein
MLIELRRQRRPSVKLGRRGTNVVAQKPVQRRGFSVAEVAEMFGACEMTVRRAIKAGELRAFRLRGKIVVPAEAVEAMTAAGASHAGRSVGRRPEGGAA